MENSLIRREKLHSNLVKEFPIQNNEFIIIFFNGSKVLVYYLLGLRREKNERFKLMILVL